MLQDGAVTGAKIADGSVTDTKLALPLYATSLIPDVGCLFRIDALGSGSPVAGYFRSQNGAGLVASSGGASIGLLASCPSSSVTLANHAAGQFALCASGHGASAILCDSAGRSANLSGNVLITGSLDVQGVKNFRIDHPLDPANKYLVHSCVESSEMMNMYAGTACLDDNGEAVVELPRWFEALNGSATYQLTAIGAPMPDLHVAAEICDNRFAIGGGKPGRKVSWQVTGVRHDAWASAHPMIVEQEKAPEERGSYVHSEPRGSVDAARTGAEGARQ
jgi:hypothetical protein